MSLQPSSRHFFIGISLAVWVLVAGVAEAAQVSVQAVRMSVQANKGRMVIDVARKFDYEIFMLSNPPRVAVDLKNARLHANFKLPSGNKYIRAVRAAPRNKNDLRIVFELRQAAVELDHFVLVPGDGNPYHRLVFDLFFEDTAPARIKPDATVRDLIVAVDAGHGGRDPGAVTKSGLLEKEITLSVAKKLYRELNKRKGIKAILVRKDDHFISLRKRINIAHKHRADLFISLHADSAKTRKARGASVYALSLSGASSESAALLANRENAVDHHLYGRVSLNEHTAEVAGVLLDLAQNATISASLRVGRAIMKNMSQVTKLHKKEVHQAGFVVLKSPDIPSLLVETGFLSNAKEERLLRSNAHQQKLAKAIAKGIVQYWVDSAPVGTVFAN